jgi:hypothetical protein
MMPAFGEAGIKLEVINGAMVRFDSKLTVVIHIVCLQFSKAIYYHNEIGKQPMPSI